VWLCSFRVLFTFGAFWVDWDETPQRMIARRAEAYPERGLARLRLMNDTMGL